MLMLDSKLWTHKCLTALFLTSPLLLQPLLFLHLRNGLILRKPWTDKLQKRRQELPTKLFTLDQITLFISNIQVFWILFTLLSSMVWDYHSFSLLLQPVFSHNGSLKDSMLHMWTNYHLLLMTNWLKMLLISSNGLLSCYVSMDIGWSAINKSSTQLGSSLTELVTKWNLNISFTLESTGLFLCFLLLFSLSLSQLFRDISQKNCPNWDSVWLEKQWKLMKIFHTFLMSPHLHKEDKWQRCTTTWSKTLASSIQIQILFKH